MTAEELVQKFGKPVADAAFEAIPAIVRVAQKAHEAWKRLPTEHAYLLFGTIVCFFGGVYPMVFAAMQAAKHGGIKTVVEAMGVLSEEIMVIVEENKKDNNVDKDGDGVADRDQMDGRELLKRKVKLVLTKMNPEKVNDAIASIYKVWLSVLAVLTIQFARTIALALTIGDFFEKLADRFVLPTLTAATPKEYRRWCPTLLDWACKSVGISVAWRIQTVISAAASALAGGLIMSRTLLRILHKGEKSHEDTKVDEIASYAFAGLGFYFQYKRNFSVPFPLNIVLFPVEIAEQYIRWAVAKE